MNAPSPFAVPRPDSPKARASGARIVSPGSSLALAAALACLAPSALAQRSQTRELPPGARIVPTSAPAVHATYDLDTGRTRVVSGPSLSRSGAVPCFDNSFDDDGVYDALLYPAGQELFDWGVKSCGGSGFVERIGIGFTSLAIPTWQGGPGGALTLRVYSGGTGHGNPGALVASIDLSGLSSSPSFPFVAPTFLEIDLGAQAFFLPDGPIGWSYTNPDGDTAPLLIDFDPALGGENAYDVYAPPPATAATYVGTFQLPPGGVSNDPKENSFIFKAFQNDTLASVTPIAAGTNPDVLRATGPVIGSTWMAVVDPGGGTQGARFSVVAIATSLIPSQSTPRGTLVIDPETVLGVTAGVLDTHRFEVPLDAALIGTHLFAQGAYAEAGMGMRLTNALDLVIGTY